MGPCKEKIIPNFYLFSISFFEYLWLAIISATHLSPFPGFLPVKLI